MGTDGLIVFLNSNREKAFHNLWDSHPDGMGVNIVRFILGLTDEDKETMIRNVKQIVWVEDSDYMPADIRNNYLSKEFHFTTYEKKIRLTNAELFEFRVKNRLPYHRWYDLLIGMQYGQCLSSILDGSLKHLVNYPMDNSEYTYWIGFENETFGMLGLNLEGEWSFDQLDKGFWGKVVDDYNYWVKKDPYSPYIP